MNIESFAMQQALNQALCFQPQAEVDLESPIPSGWEQCLDLKTGLVYFRTCNTAARTYSDPRHGYLSFSNSNPNDEQAIGNMSERRWDSGFPSGPSGHRGPLHALPRYSVPANDQQIDTPLNDQCLDLDLRLGFKTENSNISCSSMSTLSSRRREGQASKPAKSKNVVPELSFLGLSSTSNCSSSSSSPSVMSFEGHEEGEMLEVNSSRNGSRIEGKKDDQTEMMATAGCPRCLLYVMFSAKDPRCPKCGNTALLRLPVLPTSKQAAKGLNKVDSSKGTTRIETRGNEMGSAKEMTKKWL